MLHMPAWLAVDIYSLALLSMLLFHYHRQMTQRTLQRRYLVAMLLYTSMLFGFHMVGMVGDSGSVLAGVIGNFSALALDAGMLMFWLAYCSIWAGGDEASERRRTVFDPWLTAIRIYVIGNVVINVVGLWTGWFFYYDVAGVYHRGPYFDLHAVGLAAAALMVETYLFLQRRRVPRSALPFLAVFPVPPFVYGLMQLRYQGLPLEFVGFLFSLSLLHFFVQDRDANIDYLTGASNRRQLDVTLKARVARAQGGPTFAGVMCDVDKFKQINDTYGHNQGDVALECIADLLGRSFRRSDLVSRYGGDEFFVVAGIEDPAALDAAIARFKGRLEELNRGDRLPFRLEVSLGYAVFDVEKDHDVEGFRNRLDAMLYEEKCGKAHRTGDDAYLDRGRDGEQRITAAGLAAFEQARQARGGEDA